MYESENNKIFDKRTKYQVLKDEKEKDPGTVLAVFPQSPEVHNEVTELAPLSGISRANTIYGCNENGYFQTYLSDRYGFNNPDNEWDEKTIDYVLIGDSFAHGSCVNRPYDIASNLRQLTCRSVLNLGYGGNGPLSEFATLKEYLNVRMKNIIWIYYAGNDLRDLRKELKIEILKKYIQDEGFKQNLTDRQSQIDQFNYKILEKYSVRDTKRNNFRFSKLVNFIKLVETRKVLSRDIPSFHNKEVDQLIHDYLFKVLRLAKILADKNKSKLYFVYIPNYENVKKFSHKDTEFNKIESFLRTLGVPSVNIHREMIRVSDNPMSFYPYPFGMPLHFNPKGYRMVSEAIIENTKKK